MRTIRWMFCVYFALSFFLLLSGCRIGPEYSEPKINLPDEWHNNAVKGIKDGSANFQVWWTFFNDPMLNELIGQSESNNLNIKEAFERVIESRKFLSFTQGKNYPTVDLFGEYTRDRLSENGLGLPVGVSADQRNIHNIGIDSSWEIDVFGKISRSVESAAAYMEADIENYRDVMVSLYSDVAANYIDLRTVQERMNYAEENIESQKRTLKLTQNRYDAELVPELDVRQAELVLAETEASLPKLRKLEILSINRLCVLVGKNPMDLYEKLTGKSSIPQMSSEIEISVPTELLRQRPDIRRAERLLAAQTANIGVATTALYPSFSLSGTFAFGAQQFSDIARRESRFWAFGPAFSWNIFDGNRIRSNINIEESRAKQSLIQYEQTVLKALEETENAMESYNQEQHRVEALNRAVIAAKKSLELVQTLYENGLTDFQNVLDMQRSLTLQQDQLAESKGLVSKNLVSIYKALGGGWQAADVKEAKN